MQIIQIIQITRPRCEAFTTAPVFFGYKLLEISVGFFFVSGKWVN